MPTADNLLGQQTPTGAASSTYDALNQIVQRNSQPLTHDAAGNLTGDGVRTYAYDAEQRLLRIGYAGTGRSTAFRYDAFGRRTAVIESDGTTATETRYRWCGERLCQARDAADTVTRRYYDEGELAVSATGDVATFYAEDHLGSIRDLRMGDGQVLASYDYDPYGIPTRADETGGTHADYRYAGLVNHAQSGLYLAHYRAYSAQYGRWISRDPIFEAGGVNLYAYVGGNPVSYIDPIGELGFLPAAWWVAQTAWSAYQGYKAGQAFNKAQCDNPPPDPTMNDGDGPTPGQNQARNVKTLANGFGAYGEGITKAYAAVFVASVTGKFANPAGAAVGFAVGAYFGSQQPCTCQE